MNLTRKTAYLLLIIFGIGLNSGCASHKGPDCSKAPGGSTICYHEKPSTFPGHLDRGIADAAKQDQEKTRRDPNRSPTHEDHILAEGFFSAVINFVFELFTGD